MNLPSIKPIHRWTSSLERAFPVAEVSRVAEHESWRKEINRPLYHIHKWWATRLGTVFRAITLAALSEPDANIWGAFYKKHVFEGKVVLDPFMGSGTTLGEAVKLGAKAIGCDINPISSFLVRQAFTRVDETRLRHEFAQLEQSAAAEIRKYYETTDPETGERIPALYFFWVKVVTTPDGEQIPLFSKYVFSQNAYPKKKPLAKIICPHCWTVFEDRYDSTLIECPNCGGVFDAQEGPANGQFVRATNGQRFKIKDLLPADGTPLPHRLYAILALRKDGSKIYLSANDSDVALYEEAKKRLQTEDLPLPVIPVRSGHNTNQARGYNYLNWRDFFNERQLLCLGILLRQIMRIEDRDVQEQLLCLFSSTLEFNNLFCSFKGEGTGAVRHMFSHHILKPERAPLENSIWGTGRASGTFSTLFESRLLRAKKYLDEPFEIVVREDLGARPASDGKIVASNPIRSPIVSSWEELERSSAGILALNGNSAKLPLPDESVDAVITDPPYFDFVHYSELSDFFFAWLSPVLQDRYSFFSKESSFSAGEVQQKDPRAFSSQLASVLKEGGRVLKRDGVLAFSFHHSRPEGWAAIYDAIASAGLRVVTTHVVHAELRAASPKSAAKDPISVDAILVCKKAIEDGNNEFDFPPLQIQIASQAATLEDAGIRLSSADLFVIGAANVLVRNASSGASYDEIKSQIETLLR